MHRRIITTDNARRGRVGRPRACIHLSRRAIQFYIYIYIYVISCVCVVCCCWVFVRAARVSLLLLLIVCAWCVCVYVVVGGGGVVVVVFVVSGYLLFLSVFVFLPSSTMMEGAFFLHTHKHMM